jgi:hypothetical protein
MGTSDRWPLTEHSSCPLCGEPLGFYEPLVEVEGGKIRRTSRAAQPEPAWAANGLAYHAGCFDQQQQASS